MKYEFDLKKFGKWENDPKWPKVEAKETLEIGNGPISKMEFDLKNLDLLITMKMK